MRIATAIELTTDGEKELVTLGDKFKEATVVGLAVENHEYAGMIAKVFYDDGGVRYSNPGISNVYTNMVVNIKDLLTAATVGNTSVVLDPKARTFAAVDWTEDPEEEGAMMVNTRPVSGEFVSNRTFLEVMKEVKKATE